MTAQSCNNALTVVFEKHKVGQGMRISSILAFLFFAFLSCVFVSATANAQQQEITSNVFAFAAPEECLAFSAWGGRQAYDPNSGNAISPEAEAAGAKPKPLLSWRVHILPFIEQDDLYERFNLNEPWDSDHNLALLEEMPAIYAVDPKMPAGKTTIVGIGGKQGIIGTQRLKPGKVPVGNRFGSITDGMTNTVLLVDAGAGNAVEWTRPTEFEPTAEFLKQMAGKDTIVTMADCSVTVLKKDSATPEELKKMMTKDGGEINRR